MLRTAVKCNISSTETALTTLLIEFNFFTCVVFHVGYIVRWLRPSIYIFGWRAIESYGCAADLNDLQSAVCRSNSAFDTVSPPRYSAGHVCLVTTDPLGALAGPATQPCKRTVSRRG